MIGEAGVAKSSPDRQHAPAFDVLHERDLGQSLHYAVVMHHESRVVSADPRNSFCQGCRQIEVATLPVARQVLRPLFDRAVALDDPRTRDADEGSEPETFLTRLGDQIVQHLDQALHCLVTARLVVGVMPKIRLPDARFRKVRRLLAPRFDKAAADVCASDVDRNDTIVAVEYPGTCKVQRANKGQRHPDRTEWAASRRRIYRLSG